MHVSEMFPVNSMLLSVTTDRTSSEDIHFSITFTGSYFDFCSWKADSEIL